MHFDDKKKKYFGVRIGATNYAITSSVLLETRWTPEVVERRREALLKRVCEKWGIVLPPEINDDACQNSTESLDAPANADIFHAGSKKFNASGYYAGDGRFVVLKGSEVSQTTFFYSSSEKKREEMEKAGVLKGNRFLVNFEFQSPSAAAELVSGSPQNGWKYWSRKDGAKLDDVYRNKKDVSK